MDPHQNAEPENIENIFASIPQSLICKFVTHLSEFSLDDAEIDVSTDYDEDAFNKVCHSLTSDSEGTAWGYCRPANIR